MREGGQEMKFFTDIKEGLSDVQNMIFEKNWNPFIRPLVLLLIVFIGVWYINGVANSKVLESQRKVEAKKAEAESARILEKAASDAKNYRASEAARAEKEAAESRDLYDAETLRICAELKKKYAQRRIGKGKICILGIPLIKIEFFANKQVYRFCRIPVLTKKFRMRENTGGCG